MTYTISKEFAFSASHSLDGLPPEHPCSRLHGHNYGVVVRLTGDDLDDTGMVYDYGRLRPFRDFIDDTLDHRHLNDIMAANPTAEHLARYLHATALGIIGLPDGVTVAVGVSETPKTWAWYS